MAFNIVPTRLQREILLDNHRFQVCLSSRQVGKGLSLETPLATPTGWTSMGEVRPGDMLFDERGQPCRVTFVSEIHHLPCYWLRFSDGSELVADEEHRWVTSTRQDRHLRREPRIKTTAELAGTLKIGKENNHSLPVAGALHLPDTDLPLQPYTFGAWLGNGNNDGPQVTTPFAEVLAGIRAEGYVVTQRVSAAAQQRCPTYYLLPSPRRWSPDNLGRRLRQLGVLHSKHIPLSYLRAGTEQRRALLRGLMDTDGSIQPNGVCEYTSTELRLATDVFALLLTLGIKARMKQGIAKLNGRVTGDKYRITFTPPFNPFSVAHRAERWRPARRNCQQKRYLVSCDLVPSVPTRCLQVDSPSHQFLAGHALIPTHNTSLAAMVLYRAAMTRPNGVSLFFAPTHTRAGELMWKRLMEGQLPFPGPLFPKQIVKSKSLTTQTIELHNGHLVKLLGADSLQSIVGWTADQIVFDEFQDTDPLVWPYVMPMLGARQGRAMFHGTARGKNHFYDLWLMGSETDELGNPNQKRHPEWMSWRIKTADGGCMLRSEVDLARSVMSAREFAQEFEASFQGFHGAVYDEFSSANVRDDIQLDPVVDGEPMYPPILFAIDFNVDPMCTSVCIRDPQNPEHLWVVDEINLPNSDVYKLRTQIRKQYQIPYPKRRLICYPDPAGASRSAVGSPAHELLNQYGFEVLSRRAAPAIMARVLSLKARLRSADGQVRLFVHPRCTSIIKGLSGQVWNKNEPDKRAGLDHFNDGLGYLCEYEWPVGGNYCEPIRLDFGQDEFAEMDAE